MALTILLQVLTVFAGIARAQGVLSNGNSILPNCAQTCLLLNQAAQACSAAEGNATQRGWICFCQSAYLTPLTTSADGICDSTCTDSDSKTQLSKWYNSNCGTDSSASEHASNGIISTSTAFASSTSSTISISSYASSNSAPSSATTSGSTTPTGTSFAAVGGTTNTPLTYTSSSQLMRSDGTSSTTLSSGTLSMTVTSSVTTIASSTTSGTSSGNRGHSAGAGAGIGVGSASAIFLLGGLLGLRM